MQNLGYNYDKIKKIIDKYEYISFDIFDTLIKRNVEKPTDIFKLVAVEYGKIYNKKIENYEDIRIEAELEAKKHIEAREPNIDDIYKYMKLNSSEYDLNVLKDIEINLEYKLCQRNINFFPIYKYCLDKKKKIIITSDMYLNKKYIKKILSDARITGYNYLFISNDIKLNKHTGKIYLHILKKLHIKGNQLLHIGDSKRGDYIMPKLYRINSILIQKQINNLNYYNNKNFDANELINYNMLQAFINNNIPNEENTYFKIGYELLGPILYGYTTWLINNLNEYKIKKIFFLAREGNLLKKAFDYLNATDIASDYLYVSRKSTRTSLLKNIESVQDVFKIIKMRNVVTFSDFFKNIGLDVENYIELLKKYNMTEKNNVKELDNLEDLFNEIKFDIIKNAKREEQNLIGYLKQKKFCEKIAVSDVGWVGTMQNSLKKVLDENNIRNDITGFYLGQSPSALKFVEQGMKTQAYIFDYSSNIYNKEMRFFLNLFESFFLAQHGTTLSYRRTNQKYEPILGELEYTKEECKIFRLIQDGGMKFLQDYREFGKSFSAKEAFSNFKRLGLNPTLNEVNLFAKISYLETTKNNFANPKSIFHYILKPKELYIDFSNCSWKIGFLKKLIKLKLNYRKILEIIYKKIKIGK